MSNVLQMGDKVRDRIKDTILSGKEPLTLEAGEEDRPPGRQPGSRATVQLRDNLATELQGSPFRPRHGTGAR